VYVAAKRLRFPTPIEIRMLDEMFRARNSRELARHACREKRGKGPGVIASRGAGSPDRELVVMARAASPPTIR